MGWNGRHLKYFIFLLHFGGVAAKVYDGLARSWLYLLWDRQVSGKTRYTTYEGAGTKTDSDNHSSLCV
jgi:hypothetical protein